MTARHFDLVSHWRLQAPVEAVWAALAQPEGWPRWWPGLRAAHTLRPGQPGGVGRVCRLEWRTGLVYPLCIDVEALEVLRHERLRGRASGMLRGEGIWLLRGQGAVTDVTYVWRVDLSQRWMRWLAPLLAPLFRWNHQQLMRAGGAGLARHLRGPG
jgi:Polyketide cyclase / dehydrase and lipid transport